MCTIHVYSIGMCVVCVCVYIFELLFELYSISKASSLVSLHCHVVDLIILRETVHTCMQ